MRTALPPGTSATRWSPSGNARPVPVSQGRPLLMALGVATETGGRYWEAESLDRLRTAFASIAEAMGKRYILRYAPENVSLAGWHKIELKVRGKKGDVHARRGYWVAAR